MSVSGVLINLLPENVASDPVLQELVGNMLAHMYQSINADNGKMSIHPVRVAPAVRMTLTRAVLERLGVDTSSYCKRSSSTSSVFSNILQVFKFEEPSALSPIFGEHWFLRYDGRVVIVISGPISIKFCELNAINQKWTHDDNGFDDLGTKTILSRHVTYCVEFNFCITKWYWDAYDIDAIIRQTTFKKK